MVSPFNYGELQYLGDTSPPGALKYELRSSVTKSGIIDHELMVAGKTISKWILDTRESDVRKRLIALGWTPPKD